MYAYFYFPCQFYKGSKFQVDLINPQFFFSFLQSNLSKVIAMSSTKLFSLITFILVTIMKMITLTCFDLIKFKF